MPNQGYCCREYEKNNIPLPGAPGAPGIGNNQLQPQPGFAVQPNNMLKPAAAFNPSAFGVSPFMPKPAAFSNPVQGFANQQVQSGTRLNRVPNTPPDVDLLEEPNSHILVQLVNGVKKVVGARNQNNDIAELTDAQRQMVRQHMPDLVLPDAPVPMQQPVLNSQLHAPAPAPVQTAPLQHMAQAPQQQSGLTNAVAQAQERLDGAPVQQPDADEQVGEDQPQLEPQVQAPAVTQPTVSHVPQPTVSHVPQPTVSHVPQQVALKPAAVAINPIQDLNAKLRAMNVNK